MVAFVSGAVLTAAQLNTAFNAYTINSQTGTTYTYVLTDHGGLVTASNASASTYTVPPNASVAFATGDWIDTLNIGAGTVTLTPGSGVTITGTTTVPQYARARLVKTATNTWYATVERGAPGLLFIASGSPSAASTFSFNNVFSSSFDSYHIRFNWASAAGSPLVQARMRLSGVDDTTANYSDAGASGATSMTIGVASTTRGWGTIDLWTPASATPTYCRAQYGYGVTAPNVSQSAGGHNVSTAYDGITFFPASSTITGDIRIYAYVNA